MIIRGKPPHLNWRKVIEEENSREGLQTAHISSPEVFRHRELAKHFKLALCFTSKNKEKWKKVNFIGSIT